MEDDVAPLLHRYDEAPLAVSVADAPEQIADSEAFTATLGVAFTVITVVAFAVQPLELVAVTEYVVVAPGLTLMLAEVDPLLHR